MPKADCHTLTFFPLGNADCCRINLNGGKQLLFDYADMKCYDDPEDKRIALPDELRKDLDGRGYYDVVAYTHLDRDHVNGSSDFFYFEHAAKYQSKDRIKINELWVPACVILEDNVEDCARAIRQEARYRLEKGSGIRVFSRPALLKEWLEERGLSLESRAHLITDAGTTIPNWSMAVEGVEFFVHSPFASRLDDSEVIDRNGDCLVLHASFLIGDTVTKAFLGGDTKQEPLEEMIRITRFHNREERLESDIVKIPHHSSYLSLSQEKGEDITVPTENIGYFYDNKMDTRVIFVSSSRPIPADDNDALPPHRQAVKYYKSRKQLGDFKITMQHPSESDPKPLVIKITEKKGSIVQAVVPGALAAVSASSPRAGRG